MALNRDEVVTAALAILDEYGLADLTMRRLADALGVRVGALYYHVPDKQSLLAGVADAILARVPAPTAPWGTGLPAWAWALRTELLAHRDAAEVVATARVTGLARVDAAAGVTRVLREASVPNADAVAAAWLHLVLGHVAEEQARADWRRYGSGPSASPTPDADAAFAVALRLLVAGTGSSLVP